MAKVFFCAFINISATNCTKVWGVFGNKQIKYS